MSNVLARPSARPVHFRLRRRPLPYWLLATAVALATAALVGHLVGDAARERARWGQLQPTVVVRHRVPAGQRLTGRDVTVRMLPSVAVPARSLRALPSDAIAATELAAGEPLAVHRLRGRGPSAVAARLPSGTRGIAVPGANGLPLRVGDHVDVLATFDAEQQAAGDAPTFAVARNAVVIHVGHDAVTVAVAASSAARVAYALAAGAVTLVLTGTS
jgi:Flp pilus assembly protein CpaB